MVDGFGPLAFALVVQARRSLNDVKTQSTMPIAGRNRFGSIRFGSGLFEKRNRVGSLRFGQLFVPVRRSSAHVFRTRRGSVRSGSVCFRVRFRPVPEFDGSVRYGRFGLVSYSFLPLMRLPTADRSAGKRSTFKLTGETHHYVT